MTTSKRITNANAYRTHMKITCVDSKRMHTPIKSNKIIPNACQHMSTLLPSEILKTDTTLRILPFLPGNSSDGPRPTIFTNSAWSLPLHLLCEAMLPGVWNSCGFGSFWKHLDGFNPVKNCKLRIIIPKRRGKKQFSNHQLFAFGGKYQGIACKECNEVFTLFHFCRTLAGFMCFTSVHQPSNSMQFYPTNRSQCWREALWETMGFSSPLAATLHQLDTIWTLSGRCWRYLKIFVCLNLLNYIV